MRIGFFTDTFRPNLNGVVMSIDGFATQLLDLGADVTVFAPRDPRDVGSVAYRDVWDIEQANTTFPYRVHWMPSMPLLFERNHRFALPLVRRLIRIARAERLDVIHTHTPFVIGYAAVRTSRALGVPLVHTYHTQYAEYTHYLKAVSGVGRRMAPPFTRWICNLHDLVLAPSTDVKSLLHGYGVRRPVEVFKSGVDVPPAGALVPETRPPGIDESDRVLLYVGRLAPEKNLDLLLHAVDRLRLREPRIKLVLVGNGPDRQRLVRLGASLGISGHLHFAGWVPHAELRPWFAAAEVFVFPSLTETQGLSTLEAMAHSVPVVAVDGPGTRDVIQHGHNGLMVDATADRFTEGIDSLLQDPALATKYARRARRAAEPFDVRAQAKRLLKRYNGLTRRCDRSARRGLRGLAATAWEEAVAWK